MSGYVRQSSYIDGDVIQASDSNTEYEALVIAFNNQVGHSHDGSASEGPVIGLIGDAGLINPLNKIRVDSIASTINFSINVSDVSEEQIKLVDGVLFPAVTNDVDLGTDLLKFKDAYFNGTVEIGTLSISNVIGSPSFGTVDINGGTIDGTTIGADVPSTGSFTSIDADTVDIDGGTIDGTTIGGVVAASGSFTDLGATGDITVDGTVDGRDVAVDGTKLDSIEGNADVTDTTNVEAAGALMDSELTNITAVKALDQGVSTTDTPTFAGVNTNTLDLTTIEVTNIKAKDGTDSASIADSTGVMSIDSAVITSADINSGTVDATLGGTTPAAATVTTLVATNGGSLTGTWSDLGSVTTVDINGGTIDNTTVGAVDPAEGYFTNLTASGTINIDLSNISTTGVLAVSSGGTGAANEEDARTNLDVDVAGTALALSIALG